MPKIGVISLGCTKNTIDTEYMLGILKNNGHSIVPEAGQADILIINTCGFIQSAKEESIEAIFEMAAYKQKNCKLLIVTGCLAQRYEKDLLSEIPEIDILLGVGQYDKLPMAIEKALKGQRLSYCERSQELLEGARVLTTAPYMAYIRTGDGCDNKCTYCAIPLIRGNYHSRPMENILSEMTELAQNGVKEHVLVAQDTSRYGTDWQEQSMLPELMAKAAQIRGVEWLRVLYCYPDTTHIALLDTMAKYDNICKYLDLPIQHIDPNILTKMNRRGSPSEIKRILKEARDRGLALRTSIIVGFPGETEEAFNILLDFVQEQAFDHLGVFAFSPEEGTKAASMPDQIPDEIKQERLDRLMKAQAQISLKRNEGRVGIQTKAIITGRHNNNNMYVGRTEFQAPDIDGHTYIHTKNHYEPGQFVTLSITKADTYDIKGVPV